MKKKFGALSSSVNPDQLANRVKGVILSVSSFLILGAGWLGVPLTETQVVTLASQVGAVVGGIWFIYGFIQMLIAKWAERNAE